MMEPIRERATEPICVTDLGSIASQDWYRFARWVIAVPAASSRYGESLTFVSSDHRYLGEDLALLKFLKEDD